MTRSVVTRYSKDRKWIHPSSTQHLSLGASQTSHSRRIQSELPIFSPHLLHAQPSLFQPMATTSFHCFGQIPPSCPRLLLSHTRSPPSKITLISPLKCIQIRTLFQYLRATSPFPATTLSPLELRNNLHTSPTSPSCPPVYCQHSGRVKPFKILMKSGHSSAQNLTQAPLFIQSESPLALSCHSPPLTLQPSISRHAPALRPSTTLAQNAGLPVIC